MLYVTKVVCDYYTLALANCKCYCFVGEIFAEHAHTNADTEALQDDLREGCLSVSLFVYLS